MIVYFHEQQRFRQAWLWILLVATGLPVALLFGYGIYQQLVLGKPFGNRPATDAALVLSALVAITVEASVFLLVWSCRLDVLVDDKAINLRFSPFHFRPRVFSLGDVTDATVRRYSPIVEYGGWGIRYGIGRGWAYNVSGDAGVQIRLVTGKTILLGSQRSEELAAAIVNAKRNLREGMGPEQGSFTPRS